MTDDERQELLKQYEPFLADLDFIDRYCSAENAASGSEVDPNSNVRNKNVATLESEIHKKKNIFANRLRMFQTIKEMFGEDLAYQYLYDLEHHIIYRNDETGVVGKPYCAAISLYPLLINGLKSLGGQSEAPKNLESYCGNYINLIYAVSSLILGACATPEFLTIFDYFARQDMGEDYWQHPDRIVFDSPVRRRTIDQYICDKFQQVVYSLNQPAGSRTYQSPFVNFSYFDKNYFDALFNGYYFPDGTQPKWESLQWLQKRFMKWFNAERTRVLLTFPVETFSILNDGENFPDQDSADWIAQMYSEGHSFFTYTSDSVDSLSSCCFDENTPILARSSDNVFLNTTIKELHETPWCNKNNLTVYHNGSWASAKTIKLPGRKMFEITTSNHKVVKATDNHLWPTLDGIKETKDLTENDWLLFNTRALDAVPERDRKLTYNQGFIIGMYLGDGSINAQNEKYYTTTFSLNSEKYSNGIAIMSDAIETLGIDSAELKLGKIYNNVYPVRIYGTELPQFINEYVVTGYANEKRLKNEVFTQSAEFRRGILDGLYITDGGNSNRIYTTSENLARDMEALCSTIGINTILDVVDRTDEPVVIRGKEYSRNYPIWCVRWYDPRNKRTMGDVYKIVNNSMYFKIVSINELDKIPDYVYCFERRNQDEPYFTLPNGMIVHNCRLRNGINLEENVFSYTLGAGSIQTGSLCVMTLNINRTVQDARRDGRDTSDLIAERVSRIHKYLLAFRKILQDMIDAHMIPIYEEPMFIDPNKCYLTVGINGLNEGAEFLGIEPSNNEDYQQYVASILKPIYELNKEDRIPGVAKFNCEIIPGESVGVRFRRWDSKDGYWVPDRIAYNSYIYRSDDPNIQPTEKFVMHGEHYTQWLDGGSALHLNLSEHLTKEQYAKLLKLAAKNKTGLFTFNIPNTLCKDCGHITKHYLSKCPVCGSENLDYAVRPIGYLTLVSRWSLERQAEFKKRYFADPRKVEEGG